MDISADLLRAFLTVAGEGTVTASATRLHLSQPALSARIRRLERAVGTPLFTRAATGVALTAAGQAFVPAAERALAALEQGLADAAAATGAARVRIDVLDSHLAVPRRAVALLRSRLPQVELVVSDRSSSAQLRRLRRGETDVVIAGAGEDVSPSGGRSESDQHDGARVPHGLRDEPLVVEPLGVALPSGDERSKATGLRVAELRDDVHYLPSADFAPDWLVLVERLCSDAGFTPRTLPLHTESTDAPLDLVAAGECVAISLVGTAAPAGVRIVPLVDVPPHRWMLRTRADVDPTGPVAMVRVLLKTLR